MARVMAETSAPAGRRISPLLRSTEMGAVPAPVAARVTALTQPSQSMPVTFRMSSSAICYSYAPCRPAGKGQSGQGKPVLSGDIDDFRVLLAKVGNGQALSIDEAERAFDIMTS